MNNKQTKRADTAGMWNVTDNRGMRITVEVVSDPWTTGPLRFRLLWLLLLMPMIALGWFLFFYFTYLIFIKP